MKGMVSSISGKKRALALLLAALLSFAFVLPVMAAGDDERDVIKYEQIIAPQYEDAKLFSDGLAAVKKNGKWGYINEKNEVVIDFAYDHAYAFSEGYAVVGKDDKTFIYGYEEDVIYFGFIDKAGIYKPFRERVFDYTEEPYKEILRDYYVFTDFFDLNLVYSFYGGWVYISKLFDTSGNQFRSDEYIYGAPRWFPTEGLVPFAIVLDEEYSEYGYSDLTGKIVVNFKDRAGYYDAGWNPVSGWEGARYYRFLTTVRPFNQGLAIVWEGTCDLDTWEYSYVFGFMNKRFEWVIRPQYDGYYYGDYTTEQVFSSEGLASVSKDGLFGAIDKSGKVVIPFQYEELWPFFEGLAIFKKDGKCGYLDTNGSVVIPAQYEAASCYEKGLAVVYDGVKAYIINRKGEPVEGADLIDPDNYFIERADGGSLVYSPGEHVTIKDGGKYGFGKISYLQPLPDRSEMDPWAYDKVIASIEADLVPGNLQNMYRLNVTRKDYASLVIKAACTMLDTNVEDLIMERTNRSLDSFIHEYPFIDTADKDIISAYALGMVTGYGDRTYRPYNNITRQEAAVLLMRTAKVLGLDTSDPPEVTFKDSNQIDEWAAEGVYYVYREGVMTGTDKDVFSPLSDYTRQQAFITVYHLLLALLDE